MQELRLSICFPAEAGEPKTCSSLRDLKVWSVYFGLGPASIPFAVITKVLNKGRGWRGGGKNLEDPI